MHDKNFKLIPELDAVYNKSIGICIIKSYKNDLNTLESSTILWTCIELSEKDFIKKIKTLTSQGFRHPYVTIRAPDNSSIPPSVAMSRTVKDEVFDSKSTLNELLHALEQYKTEGKTCSIHVQFTKNAIDFLHSAPKSGFHFEKGEQKEMAGELHVDTVRKVENIFVYTIDIDRKNVDMGKDEDVDVRSSRYNFHSHPEEAYIRHKVKNAWPSSTDYLGFLQLGNNTIFHCVATLEGMYILSFNSFWMNNLNKVNKGFVTKHYDIDHKKKYTPEEYTKKVNEILYKGHPIYDVQFIQWGGANKIFKVSYSKYGISCIATEKSMNNYKRSHRHLK